MGSTLVLTDASGTDTDRWTYSPFGTEFRVAGSTETDQVLAAAKAELPEGLAAEVVVASGESIEDAVSHLDWQGGEIVLVGSSRLAQPRRLFLGSTAAKMLKEITVPVIVVPRTTRTEETTK